MISTEQQQYIKDNWDIFPYQLDYIIYKVMTMKGYEYGQDVGDFTLDLTSDHIMGMTDLGVHFDFLDIPNTIIVQSLSVYHMPQLLNSITANLKKDGDELKVRILCDIITPTVNDTVLKNWLLFCYLPKELEEKENKEQFKL